MSPRVLFEQDLETLKNKVSEMGEHAEISYDRMVYGIRENKEDILKTLLNTDHTMVDMQRSIEAMCLSLLTRQQPVARDMRLVSAALKVVPDIERIGDHVADIVELYLRMGNMNPEGKQEHLLLEMMEEAKEMMDTQEVVILDVREQDEFDAGHIPGAVLLPVGTITEDTAAAVIDDLDTVVLVYCRSGNRSKTASQALADLGYTNVYEFGGINSWPYEIEE